MSEITKVNPLRYWVQKVLPLVYDDSLSYYELLNKVVYKLNILIENNDNLPDYIREEILSLITPESIEEILSEIFAQLRHSIAVQDDGESATTTEDREVNTWIWLNDKLYKILRNMNAGDAYVFEGSNPNVEEISIEEMFEELKDNITDIVLDLKHSIAEGDDGDSTNSSEDRDEGTLVWLNNNLYRVLRSINAGDTYVTTGGNPNIQKITIEELINLNNIKYSIASFDDSGSNVATRNISEGELLWKYNKLYIALTNITYGTPYATTGEYQNIEEITVEEAIKRAVENEAELRTEADDALSDAISDISAIISTEHYFITPEQYGAIADGETDCTEAIQTAINEHPSAPIYFNDGIYKITDTIYCKEGIHFFLAPKAQILCDSTATLECMIYDNIADAQSDDTRRSYNSFLLGGILNGNGKCKVVFGYNYEIGMTIRDVKVNGFLEVGICGAYNIDGESDYINASNLHDNLYITNDQAGAEAITYGIKCVGSDNYYNNIQIVDCKIGLYTGGGSTIFNVHPWIHAGYFDGSIGYQLYGANKLIGCISDGVQTAIKIPETGAWVIATDFRFAFHTIPFSEVTSAGGFKFFDIANNITYRILMSNVMCQVQNDYASGGKFVNDYIYANRGVYDFIRIKNMLGIGNFNKVSNIIYDDTDIHSDGIILPENADLNDYYYPGKFYANSSTLASTIVNRPSNFNSAFSVLVEKMGSSVRQTVVNTNTNVTQYAMVATRILKNDGSASTAWFYINSTSNVVS